MMPVDPQNSLVGRTYLLVMRKRGQNNYTYRKGVRASDLHPGLVKLSVLLCGNPLPFLVVLQSRHAHVKGLGVQESQGRPLPPVLLPHPRSVIHDMVTNHDLLGM